jgi:hypothetical protein
VFMHYAVHPGAAEGDKITALALAEPLKQAGR